MFICQRMLDVDPMWSCPKSGILERMMLGLGTHLPGLGLGLKVFRSHKSVQLCFQNSIKIRGSMKRKSRIMLASEYVLGFKYT